jgi:hypothetical protein
MNSRRGGAVRQNEFPEAIMVTHTEAQAKQIFERGITHGRAAVLETMSGNRFDLDPTLIGPQRHTWNVTKTGGLGKRWTTCF